MHGNSRFHGGIDIAAPTGSPVYAPQSGIVIYSGAYGGYGNVVVLQHSGDLYTLYGHNSYLLVKYGDRINAGQVISMVGSTGRSTGPHLHFEVRQGNGYVNPLDYLGYLQKSGAYLESSNTGVHYLPPARSDKQTARAQVPAKRKKKSTWSVELIKGSDVEMVEF